MISLIRGWIFRIERHYLNPIDRQRAIGVTIMNGALLVGWLVSALAVVCKA